MIRINLLGVPKPKSKRARVAVAAPAMELGEIGSPLVKVLVALVLTAGINYFYYRSLNQQAESTRHKMAAAEAENRKLAEVKKVYMQRQKEADAYKHRVDVIDQLRNHQTTPVNLMNTIGDTVNSTEAVWLNSMKDQGANISIQGMALSTDAVANLIMNLQKTGYFSNIEIKETYQDESIKDMQAFQFELTCLIDRSKS
ncbi:MAG TPA: PilN domain-containing protein [Terriglobales bacterium]|nr:PilN domain-containing protein [Terriglobales bacterium]